MVQILPAPPPKRPTFMQQLGLGVSEGFKTALQEYEKYQKKQDLTKALQGVEGIYGDQKMTPEQKFIKAFSSLREFPEVAKSFSSGISHFSETPLQSAQRQKLEGEIRQNKGDESFLSQLMGGKKPSESEYEPYEKRELPSFMESEREDVIQPKKMQLPEPRRKQEFDAQDPTTWTNNDIRNFRGYKGTSKQRQTLAKMADNEFTRRQETEKTTREQKAVKQLLRETGKFDTEEELNEASKVYDLPTARTIWQESKKAPKPAPRSEFKKALEKKTVEGYFKAKEELPKLEASLQNINDLRRMSKENVSGYRGYIKAAFGTGSAAEYNTLAASLLEPIIKIFNPVGAVPVTKLKWINDTFKPSAGELQSTQEGKINTLERLASQAMQRAQQKIKLFDDYNGEPPESEVTKFDNDSGKMLNDFIDQSQYIDKLKKEVPKGKILMLDPQGRPKHVPEGMIMPNGMTAIEYAIQHGAQIVQ